MLVTTEKLVETNQTINYLSEIDLTSLLGTGLNKDDIGNQLLGGILLELRKIEYHLSLMTDENLENVNL